jgi:hypothetical protein
MIEMSIEQQQALDRSPELPARLANRETGKAEILLRDDDFAWIRGLLGDEPDAPRRIDPRTGTTYAILPEERYERFRAFFEEDPLTPAEKLALLREAGKRAGWDDPAWDGKESP